MDGKHKPRVTQTADTFVTDIAWGKGRWRRLLVWRREHAGRTYLRIHAWNLHNSLHKWYPTKRSYSIPIENAADLAHALLQAATGHKGEKPEWLQSREAGLDYVDHPEGWEPADSEPERDVLSKGTTAKFVDGAVVA